MSLVSRSPVQQGFGLVELMVALVVTLLLGIAVSGVFLVSNRGYRDAESFAHLQDNGRYALYTLEKDFLLAGFWGDVVGEEVIQASNLDTVDPDCTEQAAAYDTAVGLFGARVASGANTAFGCITDAAPSTDVLVIKHVRGQPLATGVIPDNDKTYLLANVATSRLFDGADTVPSTSIGGEVPNGRLWEYVAHLYYIRENPSDSNDLRLYRKTLRTTEDGVAMASEEVAAGVENMRVLYGMDSDDDGTVDRYLDSASTQLSNDGDWQKVLTAQIFLLVRGDEVTERIDDRTYALGDITVSAPGDHRHRRLVSSTVAVRNPLLRRRLETGSN